MSFSAQPVGRIVNDLELKHTGNGKPMVRFGLSVSSGFGDKRTDTIHNVSVFGENAERFAKILKKGSCVLINATEVSINTHGGNAKFDFIASDFKFLPSEGARQPATARPTQAGPRRPAPRTEAPVEEERPDWNEGGGSEPSEESEIPF